MKIKPYIPEDGLAVQSAGEATPVLDPSWWVIDEGRNVSFVISLAEVLHGTPLGTPEDGPPYLPRDDVYKGVLAELRSRLFELLAEGLDPEALADHAVWDLPGYLNPPRMAETRKPSEAESRAYRAFDLNHRMAMFSFRRLGRRPSHHWSPGLSPVELAVDNAIRVAEDRKPRDRSMTDRWFQAVITDLQKVLSIVVHRGL